jgi:hypothetical protein
VPPWPARCAVRGANVALLDVTADGVQAQAAQLGGGRHARGWAVDVRDFDAQQPTAPTERSKPPETIITNIPQATIPSIEFCSRMLVRFAELRKLATPHAAPARQRPARPRFRTATSSGSRPTGRHLISIDYPCFGWVDGFGSTSAVFGCAEPRAVSVTLGVSMTRSFLSTRDNNDPTE